MIIFLFLFPFLLLLIAAATVLLIRRFAVDGEEKLRDMAWPLGLGLAGLILCEGAYLLGLRFAWSGLLLEFVSLAEMMVFVSVAYAISRRDELRRPERHGFIFLWIALAACVYFTSLLLAGVLIIG